MKIDAYKDWLKSLVDEPGLFSDLFFETAWNTEFISIVANDENRIKDGLELRYIYGEMALNRPRIAYTRFCTILEVLIGIAKRMNYALSEPDHQHLVGLYFSELLENLGVYEVDDLGLPYGATHSMYKSIFETLVYRRYNYDGSGGGLFPIDNPEEDQRRVEIWYQMQAYLSDRI